MALLAADAVPALFRVVQADDVAAQRNATRALRVLSTCRDCGMLFTLSLCCCCSVIVSVFVSMSVPPFFC